MEANLSIGATLAAMRKTEQKICPEPDCKRNGAPFKALKHASSTCARCRDKLRKRAKTKKRLLEEK